MFTIRHEENPNDPRYKTESEWCDEMNRLGFKITHHSMSLLIGSIGKGIKYRTKENFMTTYNICTK